jgi:hypothetical protein
MAEGSTKVDTGTSETATARDSGWQRGATLSDVGWLSGLRLRRERLLAAIDSLRVEMESDARLAKSPELAESLARARALAIKHRLHSGWSQFNTARRLAVRFDDDELRRARATAIRAEANAAGKLSAWRREAILCLLAPPLRCEDLVQGSAVPTPSVQRLQAAMQLLDEGLQGIHQRNQLFAQQVVILLTMMVAATIGFTILVWRSTSLFTETAETGPLVLGICLMGSLGGSFSALSQLVASARNLRRVPDQILDGYITILRPALGVTAALVVWLFLRSGFLNIGATSAVVLACAFVAGFSDSLILRGIQAITGSAGKDERSESGAKSGTAGKEPKPAA